MGNKNKMFGLPFNVWSTERHTKKSNTASNNITNNKHFHDRMPLKLAISQVFSSQVYVITMHDKNFALRVTLKERLRGNQT